MEQDDERHATWSDHAKAAPKTGAKRPSNRDVEELDLSQIDDSIGDASPFDEDDATGDAAQTLGMRRSGLTLGDS